MHFSDIFSHFFIIEKMFNAGANVGGAGAIGRRGRDKRTYHACVVAHATGNDASWPKERQLEHSLPYFKALEEELQAVTTYGIYGK